MADTASLVVRVSSSGVAKVDKELGGLSSSSLKAERSTESLTKGLGGAAKAALTVATAAIAASGAITTIAVASAKANRELEQQARLAKMSATQFKALAFATEQYGINADQISDISKDVSDRLGEFATAGTGTFQDFIDVMGMTKAEGVALAKEFQNMTSEQVIGQLVSRMEDAGASANQMTFVLESMGNDLSKLTPLFADNAKELTTLTKSFNDANQAMALTSGQAAQLQSISTSFDLMSSSFGSASSAISATLAPTMNGFFNSIIEVVPNATNTIIDFINTFNDAADIQNVAQIDAQMKSLADTIENGVAKGYDKMSRNMQENPLDFVRVGKYQDAVARLNELEQQKVKVLEEQVKKELELKQIRSGGVIGGSGTAGVANKASTTVDPKIAATAYLEQLRQSNLTEMQLIDTQEQEKLAQVQTYKAQGLIDEQAYQGALSEIQTNAVISRAELETRALDEQSKLRDSMRAAELAKEEAIARAKEKVIDDGIVAQRNMTSDLKATLGEQNDLYKASAIVTATINTYQSATGAFAAMASIPYVGPVLGAIAAGAAITAGLANVAAISGAREQGGSMSGGNAYQMAERGKAEVIVPQGASRARTASQMREIMGQNGGGGVTGVTIVNNTSGRADNVKTEQQDDGQLLVTIEEFFADSLLNPDSRIAKARKASSGQPGF